MQLKINNNKLWYDAHMEKFIPQYAIFSYLACFAVNCLVYWFTQFIMAGAYHHDLTTEFDLKVPFVSQWIIIYVTTFIFWIVNYGIVAKSSTRDKWFQFATADMMSRLICGAIFIVLPTTTVRPEIEGTGFTDWLTSIIYSVDKPYNLFPSIHCLASWMCYIGMRGNKNIPWWYRATTMIFALLICASTQFTKQHYILDVVAGIVIAEFCYFITTHTGGYRKVMRLFDKMTEKVLGSVTDEK